MKIGILTWYYGMNHGAKAHVYALQEVLTQAGHDVYVIKYRGFKSFLLEKKWISGNDFEETIEKIKYRIFFNRESKKYKLTRRVFDGKQIDKIGFDRIILGSDEIFNLYHPITKNDFLYFGVGIKNTKLITYAVSCGLMGVNDQYPASVKESLYRINDLSVRDYHSARIICNNIGINPPVVLDPTLLMDFSFEKSHNCRENGYLLIYGFKDLDGYSKDIMEFARKKDLKIISVGKEYSWASKSFHAITQKQWYQSFQHASYVITDSYHGTIFAIKCKKEFAIVGSFEKTSKLQGLLEQVGISRGFWEKRTSLEKYFENKIDYDKVRSEILKKREQSLEFLHQSLKE